MPKANPQKAQSGHSKSRIAPYSKKAPVFEKNADKENRNPHAASFETLDSDWRSIELELKKDEVPCYDNASMVRQKLNKLLNGKSEIPGSTKKWSRATMAKEMEGLEARDGAPERANRNGKGPTPSCLNSFLKKTGSMGGGDSDAYYWGFFLLEKLRIHRGEAKSKARLESEKARPSGFKRWDPSTVRFLCRRGLPPPNITELSTEGR